MQRGQNLKKKSPALQGWPLDDIWEPDLNGKQLPALIRDSLNDEGVPRLCIQTLRVAENHFLPGSLEFWHVLGRGCLCDQPWVTTLGMSSLMSSPGWQHLTCVVTVCCWGIKHSLHDSTGRRLWGAWAWFPLGFTPWSFSFRWYCLGPFSEINLSHKYNYVLSPVSPPSKLSSLEVVAGPLHVSPQVVVGWWYMLNPHGLSVSLAILPSLSVAVPKEYRASCISLK